jgi:hypothetical protein
VVVVDPALQVGVKLYMLGACCQSRIRLHWYSETSFSGSELDAVHMASLGDCHGLGRYGDTWE